MADDDSQQRKPDFQTALEDGKALATVRPKVWAAFGVVFTLILALTVVIVLLLSGGSKALSANAALIGALVGLGGVFTTQLVSISLEDRRAQETRAIEAARTQEARNIEEQRTQKARDIEEQRTQEAALKQYLEQMGELVEKGLRKSPSNDEVREVRVLARTQTLLVLRGLDPGRKWLLMDFLYDSNLLNRAGPVVDLTDADLRKGVFSEYLTFHAIDSSDVRGYLGGADPREYLSKGDLREVLQDTDNIPESLLEIFLYEPTLRIELNDADLRGTLFIQAYLRQVVLRNSNLEDAILAEADLIGATLSNAYLRNANLMLAVLIGAKLNKADLRSAALGLAVFLKAELQEADLQKADLQKADLREADLRNADLREANLQEADLREANLRNADLREANLLATDLRKAILRGANLSEVKLGGADLSAADLHGAIDLTRGHVEFAIGDEKTKLPEYLVDHRPQAWCKGTEEQMEELMKKLEILNRLRPEDE